MAPYDSDSSGGEDTDFTETNVLLGYAAEDSNGEVVSRLGGRPDWLDPTTAPSSALARCKVCKDLTVLLLQLNGELPDRFPGHERRLYIFGCRRKICRRQEGSIRAIRGVRIAPDAPTAESIAQAKQEAKEAKDNAAAAAAKAASAASQGLGNALFGVKTTAGDGARVNPFASASANPFAPKQAASANPFSGKPASTPAAQDEKPKPDTVALTKTFAETLSLSNNKMQPPPTSAPAPEPWPQEAEQPKPYPVRWISDAEYETLDPSPALPLQNVDMGAMEIDSADAGGSGGGKEDKEVYESTMDATFQKFADRVGENPDQCLRYEFAGQPLLYSKDGPVGKLLYCGEEGAAKVNSGGAKGFPRCGNCGAGRVFEMQLTPHAIEELEIDEDGLDGMDWGTVIVGVCEKDCQEQGVEAGQAGYLEEWAGVQWEEVTVKR
ncbi:programmed cell death protein 2 [Podospora appendiculata]|uniref:Programmed cell death protein 2 n=1 Tax=Podospora appendiculata TaxID=314037 RepID=A0AAE0XB65_9PEZI|nr:programmed cell death protein 2 [Podospora appendiculata]